MYVAGADHVSERASQKVRSSGFCTPSARSTQLTTMCAMSGCGDERGEHRVARIEAQGEEPAPDVLALAKNTLRYSATLICL